MLGNGNRHTVFVVSRDPKGDKISGSLPAGDAAADKNPG